MDLRHFNPADVADVTQELGEERPGENRLYRLSGGEVVKVKSFWITRAIALPGQREVELRASLCDERGQALPDGQGGLLISEPHYVVLSPAGERTLEDQVDEGRRRWALAYHHTVRMWATDVQGVAVKPEPQP